MALRPQNGIDLGGQRAFNAGDASNPTDLVTLQQLQAFLNGLSWKPNPVRVATTTNGALATAYAAGQSIDGVALTTGMRILIKDQTTGSENGIYTVNASGAPTRAVDADSSAELQNATVLVIAGTANADKAFTQTVNDPTLGTTALAFAQLPGAGSSYTQGNGISISGGIITAVAKASGGVIVDSNGISLDPSIAVRKYVVALAAATAGTAQTVTHNLGTKDVDVTVVEVSTGQDVLPDLTRDTVNTVQVVFGSAIAAGAYRIVVMA